MSGENTLAVQMVDEAILQAEKCKTMDSDSMALAIWKGRWRPGNNSKAKFKEAIDIGERALSLSRNNQTLSRQFRASIARYREGKTMHD